MKSILRLVLATLVSFLTITLISGQGNGKTAQNSFKYVLIEMENFSGKVNVKETYKYYYVEFRNNGEFALCYNLKEKNEYVVQLGSYNKTDNMYIVNTNGMVLNYIINDNKLQCEFMMTKMVFELEE